MAQRAAYHTTLKELVHFGLLPKTHLKEIPRSNIHRWKQDDFNRYKGSEINTIADNHTKLIQTLNQWPEMFSAYGKLVNTMISIAQQTRGFKSVIRSHKTKVIKAIITAKKHIPIKMYLYEFGCMQ